MSTFSHRGRRGRDRMLVGYIATYVVSVNPTEVRCTW